MRVTVETRLDAKTCEQFLCMYRASFAPLEAQAAGRQSLHDDEFREEMGLESVVKVVAWERDGTPAGLAFAAKDLSTVAWISPAYYAMHFPDEYARNAIYYFGGLLVSPDKQGGPWAYALMREIVRLVVRDRAIVAFDTCQLNTANGLPDVVRSVANQVSPAVLLELDNQRYYVCGPADALLPQDSEVLIDLVEMEAADRAARAAITTRSTTAEPTRRQRARPPAG